MYSPTSNVIGYLQTPVLPRNTSSLRIKLLLSMAVAILVTVLLVHAFSPQGLSARELAIHVLTIWLGFFLGVLGAVLLVAVIPGAKTGKPTVGLLWVISAAGFVLGIFIVSQLETVAPMTSVAAKASSLHGPTGMLLRLIPVWLLVTAYFARNEILKAYQARLAAFESPPATERTRPVESSTIRLGSGKSAVTCDIEKIILVSAEENYCRVLTQDTDGSSSVLVRATMGSIAGELSRANFIRVHRSHLVNTNYVEQIKKLGRRLFVVLVGVAGNIPISRHRYKEVIARLEETGPDHREKS